MLSQAVQDYLKTIYKFEESEGLVSTTNIASELGISGASVTGMLKRLSSMGLVDYNSYKGVRLTASGKKIALSIIRHHRLLETFLKVEMGFSLDMIHEEACRLEHHISEYFVDKIDEKLGFPNYDPHGHPIPSVDGELPDSNEVQLHNVTPGFEVTISRLSDHDPEMLAYFENMGLVPNVKLEVLEKAPFSGPITIKYNSENQIIGNEVAKNIFVEKIDNIG